MDELETHYITMFNLTGKVAVVTGAGGVLCSYFAKVLARAGAKVALLDLNEEAAKQFADAILEAKTKTTHADSISIKKEWFEKIKSGEKTHEYREMSDYWIKRI